LDFSVARWRGKKHQTRSADRLAGVVNPPASYLRDAAGAGRKAAEPPTIDRPASEGRLYKWSDQAFDQRRIEV
jgi:hypothetical protein